MIVFQQFESFELGEVAAPTARKTFPRFYVNTLSHIPSTPLLSRLPVMVTK